MRSTVSKLTKAFCKSFVTSINPRTGKIKIELMNRSPDIYQQYEYFIFSQLPENVQRLYYQDPKKLCVYDFSPVLSLKKGHLLLSDFVSQQQLLISKQNCEIVQLQNDLRLAKKEKDDIIEKNQSLEALEKENVDLKQRYDLLIKDFEEIKSQQSTLTQKNIELTSQLQNITSERDSLLQSQQLPVDEKSKNEIGQIASLSSADHGNHLNYSTSSAQKSYSEFPSMYMRQLSEDSFCDEKSSSHCFENQKSSQNYRGSKNLQQNQHNRTSFGIKASQSQRDSSQKCSKQTCLNDQYQTHGANQQACLKENCAQKTGSGVQNFSVNPLSGSMNGGILHLSDTEAHSECAMLMKQKAGKQVNQEECKKQQYESQQALDLMEETKVEGSQVSRVLSRKTNENQKSIFSAIPNFATSSDNFNSPDFVQKDELSRFSSTSDSSTFSQVQTTAASQEKDVFKQASASKKRKLNQQSGYVEPQYV
eukprot:403338897